MTCFVSRVRATRCGRSAGLSRRGPLDFCPKEDKLTPYKSAGTLELLGTPPAVILTRRCNFSCLDAG
jgi:hypothetical protein